MPYSTEWRGGGEGGGGEREGEGEGREEGGRGGGEREGKRRRGLISTISIAVMCSVDAP